MPASYQLIVKRGEAKREGSKGRGSEGHGYMVKRVSGASHRDAATSFAGRTLECVASKAAKSLRSVAATPRSSRL